jgi:hypothetical protein
MTQISEGTLGVKRMTPPGTSVNEALDVLKVVTVARKY